MTALSGNFLENVWKMPELINELLHFLHRDFPESHPFANLTSGPLPDLIPEPWLLGTSKKSGKLAAENGTFYAYGEFMSESDGIESLNEYKQNFKSRGSLDSTENTRDCFGIMC